VRHPAVGPLPAEQAEQVFGAAAVDASLEGLAVPTESPVLA
jgi:hypothetical protein